MWEIVVEALLERVTTDLEAQAVTIHDAVLRAHRRR